MYVTVSKGYRSGGYNVQMFSDLLQSSLKNDMMRQSKEAIMPNVPDAYKELVGKTFLMREKIRMQKPPPSTNLNRPGTMKQEHT